MASQVFADDIICLSGTFPAHKHNDLKVLVKDHGGTFSPRLRASCTHLVTTQEDIDNSSDKYKQSRAFPGIRLLNVDWLLDSIKDKKRLDESPYLLTSSASAAATPPAAPARTRPTRTKRAADSQTDGGVDATAKDAPAAKKQKDDASKQGTATKNGSASAAKKETPDKTAPKLKVPIDSNSHEQSGYQVYIDDNGVIYDGALNQTNASHNNNKFYIIQLLVRDTQYVTWMRWGRVGENGQTSVIGGSLDNALRAFMKKFRDKSGLAWENRLNKPKPGKYTYIERNYEDEEENEEEKGKNGKKFSDDDEVDEAEQKMAECTLSKPVQHLVGLIFNQQHWQSTMASMEYDANKLPLGKLSQRTLQSGFQLLKDLSELINHPNLAKQKHGQPFGTAVETLSNQYFTVIPHAFGRRRPPIMGNQQLIKQEVNLLETLTDMEIANEIMNVAKTSDEDTVHPLDRQYMGLNMREMTPLDPKSTEYRELDNYLVRSCGPTHHASYKLQNVFRIEREGESDRYLNSPFASIKNSNRRLLWHGSRTTNYGGILSQGLRIAPPEAPVTGYMFGKGVYFADMSSKSGNYCCSYNSGNMGLLMLCDVELGDPMLELKDAEYQAGEHAKKENKLATLGQGLTVPAGWKDAVCVHPDLEGVLMPDTTSLPTSSDLKDLRLQYNEYIVYDVAQIRLKYLLLVHMR